MAYSLSSDVHWIIQATLFKKKKKNKLAYVPYVSNGFYKLT